MTERRPPLRYLALGGVAAALLVLSGCISVAIDEGTAFAPPKRTAGTASPTELSSRWRSYVESAGPSSGLTLQEQPGGVTRLRGAQPAFITVDVSHGTLSVPDGQVAWSLFTRTAGPADPARPLILHCAGNAGDRYNSAIGYAQKALPWGDVLIFDYPGYGDSTGPASADSFEAAFTVVLADAERRAAGRPLVFWGHSLGGFVCSELAARSRNAQGLILEATAPNAAAVARAWVPGYARPFVRTRIAPSLARYDTAQAAVRFRRPVLVLGATKDTVLPVQLSRTLAGTIQSAGAPVTYVEFPAAGHGDIRRQPTFAGAIDPYFSALRQAIP